MAKKYLIIAGLGAGIAALASSGYLDSDYMRHVGDAGRYVEYRVLEPVCDAPAHIINSRHVHGLAGVVRDTPNLRNVTVNPNTSNTAKVIGLGALLLGIGAAIRRRR